ncbi:MAG: GCAxxG family protein [Clostridia bacterium]|jgi:C_GCAxxG_C_C family probable redox protein|nr:GCAxxG family protein [Clostridia bacterium]
MKRSDVAVERFLDGYNCAQAVLYSFCDYLNFDKDTALKLSCGFGAGMGRKEEVCGAVSGGIMVIGMLYGRGENQDRSLTENTYLITRELMDKFTERQGAFICRRLLGDCELTTLEGQKEFKDKDLLNTVCKACVRNVVEIIDDIVDRSTLR